MPSASSPRLDDSREGGLNLGMDTCTMESIVAYGRSAGECLVTRFNMDQHRYDRAISLLPEIEGAFVRLAESYRARPSGAPPSP